MSGDAQPIAFPVEPGQAGQLGAWASLEGGIPTLARSLGGMQKEALVQDPSSGRWWRLLCDEGPWLNGTDLAPFPLGYFAAGLASSFSADILAEAARRTLKPDGLDLRLDIRFTMEGSLLRGTMAAGVDSVRMSVRSASGGSGGEFREIVDAALRNRSIANRVLGERLPSRFRLQVRGEEIDWPARKARTLEGLPDPAPAFEGLNAPAGFEPSEPVIRKDREAMAADREGAVGLEGEQKRTVLLSADARVRRDGLTATSVRCVRPPGSRFVLLSDGRGADSNAGAPAGLVYLCAGIAFCFMTQLGRYAQIKKTGIENYRLVQSAGFRDEGTSPVETAVFLDSDESPASSLKMVQMGEQTCYVHTSLREAVDVHVDTALRSSSGRN